MGLRAPVPWMRATMLNLRGFGPRSWTSAGGNPASRRRWAMAFAAVVTLPAGVSVVLISMSCLKMERARSLVASSTCARSSPGAASNTSASKQEKKLRNFIRRPPSEEKEAYQRKEIPARGRNDECLSSIILSPLNGNVKLSPHETGDIHVESEGTAASDRHFAMRAREPDVCQSRGAARPITAACQTA